MHKIYLDRHPSSLSAIGEKVIEVRASERTGHGDGGREGGREGEVNDSPGGE